MKGAPWGGSEEFWYRMAAWLSQNGYKVDCCFIDWPTGKSEQKNRLQQSGCTLHVLPNPVLAKNYFGRLLLKNQLKRKLLQVVRKKYELVCLSQGGLADLTYSPFNSIRSFLGNYIIIYHNYNESQVLSDTRKRRLKAWATGAVQNLVAAERILTVVEKIAAFSLPLPQVLVNPITIPVQGEPQPWPSLNNKGNYVWVAIGQLDVQRKAQDILVKTLASEKWKARNWELHIYGDGPDRQLLATLIAELDLEQKIFLEGHTNNIEAVLKTAHMLFQVTHVDAMPLSVTEAMNMARPCVVSNVGDMPLWIEDGQNGYVVPVTSEASLDEVLEKAWQQRNSWEQAGINAFQVFRQMYPQPYEASYGKMFERLL
jgi:glycosyltransferase involved in cell wall biosynthesis